MKEFTHPNYPTIHIKLLNTSKDFNQLKTLLSSTPFLATDLINFIPKTTTLDSKYLYGIFDEEQLIGVIDLIEDYPTNKTAYINVFFIHETFDNFDFSQTLYIALEKMAQETGITSFEFNPSHNYLPFFDQIGFNNQKKIFTE